MLKECNNNKEKNKAKSNSLNSESIVAILDQSGINKSKTYLDIIDTETFSHVMDKEVASMHQLYTNTISSTEKMMTRGGVFKATIITTLGKIKV